MDFPASKFRGVARHLKDTAVALAIRGFLNARLAGICKVTGFSIDSATHTLHLTGCLAGTGGNVEVRIERYEFKPTPAGLCLTIYDSHATPLWLNGFLERFIAGRHFVVLPPGNGKREKRILRLVKWLS